MIDFTKCPTKNKSYNGANGKKIAVEYDGSLYMLKFPTVGKINTDMHYTNGCISEYLGCHIFNIIGIKAQETLLGTYAVNRKRINSYNFLTSTENEDCCRAVVRIEHAIDLEKFYTMIEETPSLTDLQVEFYKKMITSRKTMILDVAYKRIKRIKPELFTEQDKGNVFFGDVSEGYEEADIDTR